MRELATCDLVTPSPHHPITPSPCHPITSSPCHPITPSPHHPVSLSPHHPITPSPCHLVTLSPCLPSPRHRVLHLKPQHDFTRLNLVAVAHRLRLARRQPLAVEQRAVGAVHIFDHDLPALDEQAHVT